MSRWVLLGSAQEKFASHSARLIRNFSGPYVIKEKDGNIYFAIRLLKDKHLIDSSKWIDRKNYNNIDIQIDINSIGMSDIDSPPIPDIQSIPKIFERKEGIYRFELIQRVVFHSSLSQLPRIFYSVLCPEFFQDYPKGHILFLSASEDFQKGIATLRVLGAALELANKDYETLKNFGPLKLMTDAQGSGVLVPTKYLTIPLSLFLPKMYGFTANKVTIGFLFLLDQPIKDVRAFYPRSGLEFFRSEAGGIFRQALDIELADITPEVIDTFSLLSQSFSVAEIKAFIVQYLSKLDEFLKYLLDPSNFVNKDSKWVGLRQYFTWLCFERIGSELVYLLTDDSPYLRKTALFRILDQLASLKSNNQSDQPRIFKSLLLPENGVDLIAEGLAKYSGNVASYLQSLLIDCRKELIDTSLASVFIPGRVDLQRGIVKLSSGKEVSIIQFVSSLVRELRNTYHGYHTSQFENYLAISSGNTPDRIPVIGVLAFFAMLSMPHAFVGRDWN